MHSLRRLCVVALLLGIASGASAAVLDVTVSAVDGRPLPHAVVVLYPVDFPLPPRRASGEIRVRVSDGRITPPVLPVRRGTTVIFEQFGEVRHQLYSFSEAKRFRQEGYPEGEPLAVQMNRVGHVAIGCGIHDGLAASVYVTESPWFTTTDATGRARLDAFPAGRYRMDVWHPGIEGNGTLYYAFLDLRGDGVVDWRLALDVTDPAFGQPTGGR